MGSEKKSYTYHRFGENALLIKFEPQIDEHINQQVTQLNTALLLAELSAITFTIPAYCSLTVGFTPTLIDYETLCLFISNLNLPNTKSHNKETIRKLSIPICYDKEFALDIAQLAQEKQITEKEVIQHHSEQPYKVYMLGFLPGFAFMGKVPKALTCNRKREPRLKVPALSVGIAGEQTGIYPAETPGGWQIIGKTPIAIFDAKKEDPFLFQPGDKVQFYPISKKEFMTIQKDLAEGSFKWQAIYE